MKPEECIQQLYQKIKQIGGGLTVSNTSTLPTWNTLVSQIVRLKLNIDENEIHRYAHHLQLIKQLIPQAKTEIAPCSKLNNDDLFAELKTISDVFMQWVDQNVSEVTPVMK